MNEVEKFIQDQLSVWPMAAANFRSLKSALIKDVRVFGVEAKVQCNPERIISSTAEIDEATIAARPCFLCPSGRPKEQFHIKFDGRKGRRYNVQVNPYPIFPRHLVLARDVHTDQSIWHCFVDAMDFARRYPDYLVFYNGPKSGASAPDHMHFQACPKGQMPLQNAVDAFLDNAEEPLTVGQDAKLYRFPDWCRGVYALKSGTPKSLAKLFYRLIDCAPKIDGDPEPRFNLFTYCYKAEFRAIVVLRGNLRSHHYYAEGDEHLTMSPGAADVAGMFVAPIESDFRNVNGSTLEQMLSEVSISEEEEKMVAWRLTRTQRRIDAVVAKAPEVKFEMISDGAGPQVVSFKDGRIDYNGMLYDELYFDKITPSTLFGEPSFIIYDAEGSRRFAGSLKFTVSDGQVKAINHVGVENYLLSTVSQISSSVEPYEDVRQRVLEARSSIFLNKNEEFPDYFGLSIAMVSNVRKAIDETWGQLLHENTPQL